MYILDQSMMGLESLGLFLVWVGGVFSWFYFGHYSSDDYLPISIDGVCARTIVTLF